MYYALIHNDKIQVGPRDWNYNFFKRYLQENSLNYDVLSYTPPSDNMIITDDWRIIPVNIDPFPEVNTYFEQLAGPFLTIHDLYVSGYYNVVPIDLDISKGLLKSTVTGTRYNVEVGGCPFILNDGTKVTLYTTREDRNVYLQAYQIMSDSQTIVFKFPNSIFKEVGKEELGRIVQAGATHIQTAFNWESNKYAEIDACTTIEQLRQIDINYSA